MKISLLIVLSWEVLRRAEWTAVCCKCNKIEQKDSA